MKSVHIYKSNTHTQTEGKTEQVDDADCDDADDDDDDDDAVVSRLYYSDCELSSVNTGSVFTCNVAAVDCRSASVRRRRPAAFVCVSSLVVSQRQQRLYWADVGRGLIASASINSSVTGIGRVRCLRCVHFVIASSSVQIIYSYLYFTYLLIFTWAGYFRARKGAEFIDNIQTLLVAIEALG